MGYVDGDTMSNWYKEEVENVKRWDTGNGLLYEFI